MSTDRPPQQTGAHAGVWTVPAALRPLVRNLVLRRAVPFTGTAVWSAVTLTPEKVEITIANQRRVQNHIRGVHAAAMTCWPKRPPAWWWA
jgi:hypothetical protein